ncbi:MAG: hypothetical protein SVK08_11620 [Halobacteriota archaeon]|nr:hypothetical protein [Halobacteriota archaeon]
MEKWKSGAVIGVICGMVYTFLCPLLYVIFTVTSSLSTFEIKIAPILCEAISAPTVFWYIIEGFSAIMGVSPTLVHKFFSSSAENGKLLVVLILLTWSGIGALIGAGVGYLMDQRSGTT